MSCSIQTAHAFLNALGQNASGFGSVQDTASALTTFLKQARSEAPGIEIDDEVFLLFVSQKLRQPSVAELTNLHWGDLLIALGCALGHPAAIETLERSYMKQVAAALRPMSAPSQQVEDMLQVVRQQIIVEGRIAEYAGRGPLRAWLRIAATRAVIKLGRKGNREVLGENETLLEGATSSDPELLLIKQVYRASFKQAFQASLDDLPSRDKLVLQQYVVDRLTVDDLAHLHGVHRATAARWVSQARERLVAETRRRFINQATWSVSECESVLRLVASNLDATIVRRLAAAGEGTPNQESG